MTRIMEVSDSHKSCARLRLTTVSDSRLVHSREAVCAVRASPSPGSRGVSKQLEAAHPFCRGPHHLQRPHVAPQGPIITYYAREALHSRRLRSVSVGTYRAVPSFLGGHVRHFVVDNGAYYAACSLDARNANGKIPEARLPHLSNFTCESRTSLPRSLLPRTSHGARSSSPRRVQYMYNRF